ncbi:hypothetical protein [Xanthomonas sp. GW]|uniref:hypothetical protein n=1 Tax=Xanthomonas sp. GW TaxID=2724121 RepID=UPI00163AD4A0|nr:hypothetical protein [Xanthomonas sp. GW]
MLRTSGHRCKTYCGTAQAAVPASRFVNRGKAGCGRVQASDAALAPFFLPGICSFCSEAWRSRAIEPTGAEGNACRG